MDNPSFYVLTIPNPGDVPSVEGKFVALLGANQGSALTPISANRYVLARVAAKRLSLGRAQGNIQGLLSNIPGVQLVRKISGTEIALPSASNTSIK